MGIEPTLPAWEAGVLPLNYTRIHLVLSMLQKLISRIQVTEEKKYLRQIKSFICRSQRMTDAQAKALETYWPLFGLKRVNGTIDFNQVFGNANSVVLEIGFGTGEAIAKLALANPDINYLGVEVYSAGVASLLLQIGSHHIKNVRIYQNDVNEVLTECIPDESLSGINIFFPDPWPKRRHQKRRLIQSHFIELLAKKIKLNGFLHIATDWEHYALHIDRVLQGFSQFKKIEPLSPNLLEQSRPSTKFARRGQKLGYQLADFYYVKI